MLYLVGDYDNDYRSSAAVGQVMHQDCSQSRQVVTTHHPTGGVEIGEISQSREPAPLHDNAVVTNTTPETTSSCRQRFPSSID